MNKDYWKEKFLELNNTNPTEDDLLFLVDSADKVKVVRKPYISAEDDMIDYQKTVKLNQVIQKQFLIAITVCSINSNGTQIVCVQKFLECCFPTPNLHNNPKYVEFSSVTFPEFFLNQRDSLLCIEIIQSSQKINLPELESESKGMRYRSMRGLGRIIFEGSISFEDIMAIFKPLNFTKALVLRGPYNQGKITIWVTKRFSFFL